MSKRGVRTQAKGSIHYHYSLLTTDFAPQQTLRDRPEKENLQLNQCCLIKQKLELPAQEKSSYFRVLETKITKTVQYNILILCFEPSHLPAQMKKAHTLLSLMLLSPFGGPCCL